MYLSSAFLSHPIILFIAMIKRILHFLLKPFREHHVFMIAFFVLIAAPYIVFQLRFGFYHHYINTLLIAIHCAVISYFTTLLVSLIQPKILRKTIQSILIGLAAIMFATNIFCILKLHTTMDEDYLMLILDTNPNEAYEFITAVLPKRVIIIVSSAFILLLGLWGLSSHFNLNLRKKGSLVALALMGLFTIEAIHSWYIWQSGPLCLLKGLYDYETMAFDKPNNVKPCITFSTTQPRPNNIVLIIGESFARFHSSLYGYDKMTNPRLVELKKASLLYTFDSIDAPAPTTALSLKYMLTTCSKSKSDSISLAEEWRNSITVFDLLKACGYDSYWFSNQARNGRFNYMARAFAKACKENHFYQNEGSINDSYRLDQVLVDSSYQFTQHLEQNSSYFIIYHLMGSHFNYSQRYPKDYDHFSPDEYSNYPQHQRLNLSIYDNSILYNDYIVEQIINLFKDTEAIVIYIPDHGQDMYRSSPDYFTHGIMNDPVSYAYGVEVPLMIYASPVFQEKHPDTMQRIKYRQDHPKAWNTENLPYLILDLIGATDINGENIQSKSILN